MSAEDSEIMSITNSAIESLNKSDSFRSLVGDDFRQFLILPLGGYAFYKQLNVTCTIQAHNQEGHRGHAPPLQT